MDYVLCRRGNLKEIGDCKVVAGECVARQHRMVVCKMTLEEKKRRRVREEPRIRWWKLRERDMDAKFREEVRLALGGREDLPDDWVAAAEIVRESARKVLGVKFGQRREDKETWWWNEDVQESIKRKRLTRRNWYRQRDLESRREYKEARKKRSCKGKG